MIPEYLKLSNEDNMQLMSRYTDNYFDLAIVDPPYSSGADAVNLVDSKSNKAKRTKKKVTWNDKPPNKKYFKELRRISKNQIVWGGNFFGLSGGVIAWNKHGTAFGEGEISICTTHNSVRFFEYTWNGMIQQDMKNKELINHPTQKPVALYEWLLKNYAKTDQKILDTHLGSASIAIAVHRMNERDNMNLELTGCELDPEYFNDSIKRIEKEVNQKTIFSI